MWTTIFTFTSQYRRYEFVSYVLLQYGLVQKEDLDEIIEMCGESQFAAITQIT